ncbi:hypothetical protein BDK92_6402 [Micromonospora pisi]|uniref:Uncharacterized protein n=1 Tax=Micromonospora pisi TaxID=589240 RepID=A0A495JT00_9ACTN|nr:hypothetical protein [Micromonospora pisi]RKR91971.1 hypothetical protein BDK92_6402 [Micromonospora pisi]
MGVVLRGVVLRDLVVVLEPGEWYVRFGVPAATRRTIRLGDVDRIHTRLTGPDGKQEEMWVSGHKGDCRPTCGRGCIAEYVALAAVERALVKRDGPLVIRPDEAL